MATNLQKKPPLNFRCTFSGTISDALRRRGWSQTNNEYYSDWSLFFCDMVQFRELCTSAQLLHLRDYQRVGHFRNCQEISRKNLLVKNLKKFKQKIERNFGKPAAEKCDFMPETFVLPAQHNRFLAEFRCKPESLWIIKPAAGAQGRGIFIFKSPQDYLTWLKTFDYQVDDLDDIQPTSNNNNNNSSTDPSGTDAQQSTPQSSPVPSPRIDTKSEIYVVQKYITNPYLIGGRKFDIRFYVLVTNFQPLRCYMYREGFARFSAGQFSLDALQDVYIHLTNVAIQRTSEDYNPEKGSKWSLQSLREYLTARHGREKVQGLFNAIDFIVIRTLQCAVGLVINDKHCFEIYGFDVIIDRDLKPWLLEVNASPAFTPSNEEDYILKLGLIDDTVSILDFEGRLTGFEKRVGGYDLLYNGGPVYANPADCGHAVGLEGGPKLNSFLGCKNDRVPQLRDLYRSAHIIKTTTSNVLPADAKQKVEYHYEGGEYFFSANSKNAKDERFKMPL